MGRIFITRSFDGLGLSTAKQLVSRGHTVYLHGRDGTRAEAARAACPGAADLLLGDLASMEETRALASSVAALGPLDCILHNAGLYLGPYRAQAEGYPSVFAVNVLAPYLLTCLVPRPRRPRRMVFVSAGTHRNGSSSLDDFGWRARHAAGQFSDEGAYADTKLYNVMLGYAFARRFAAAGVVAHSVDPGWVSAKMGGTGGPGDVEAAERLYVMLAEGSGEAEGRSGCYWETGKKGPASPKEDARDEAAQDALLEKLAEITGVAVPEP
ncbi:short chain dehydrogenase [Nemania serpens]|nr:short chain dehydrogenase [Nemania serpens]